MSNKLPAAIKDQVLEMPEYRQGTNKIRVVLKDGRKYTSVFVAWADEIVKVGSSTVIPFDAEDIVEVDNDL
jgi:hypothetical protein